MATKLGILSDTHGFFHEALSEVFAGVDLICHAGDIGEPEILDRLEAIAPVRAVWGNIDGGSIRSRVPKEQTFAVEGLRFWMIHIGGRPGRWKRGIRAELEQRRPDVFICGHSHIFGFERVEEFGGLLYINPGAAGQQGFHQFKTVVRLGVSEGQVVEAKSIELDARVT